MTNGNDFAHPTDVWCESRNGGFYQEGTDPGLTKREYFAAMAMQGILAGFVERCENNKDNADFTPDIANDCVFMADALIDALNAERPSTGS